MPLTASRHNLPTTKEPRSPRRHPAWVHQLNPKLVPASRHAAAAAAAGTLRYCATCLHSHCAAIRSALYAEHYLHIFSERVGNKFQQSIEWCYRHFHDLEINPSSSYDVKCFCVF